MIVFVHNRYRFRGGEERAVERLIDTVRSQLNEQVGLIEADSSELGRVRASNLMLSGGRTPNQLESMTDARILHAHNLHPSFGWRTLAKAQDLGLKTVFHLHNYRLVCAVGTCFKDGKDCTSCSGQNTLPGIRHNCRGSHTEASIYATAIAIQQRKLIDNSDVFAVPSRFAADRLVELGLDIADRTVVIPNIQTSFVDRSRASNGRYALIVSRLSPEKGISDAIVACSELGLKLVIAGTGPIEAQLKKQAVGSDVEFTGNVEVHELERLRLGASIALLPSRWHETSPPLAIMEAMADGLPVAAASVGGVPELVPREWCFPPGDIAAMKERIQSYAGDQIAGDHAIKLVHTRSAPESVAEQLRTLYS